VTVDPRAARGFADAVDAYERGRPSYPRDAIKLALQESRLFAPLSSAELDHVHRISGDDFVALVASWSWIANLPCGQRAAVLTQVGEMAGANPQLTLSYRTEIHWTRLA